MWDRRVWTGLGNFRVKWDPTTQAPIRDSIKVYHDGELGLEVVDPTIIIRVLKLCIYDLVTELQDANRTTR